MAQAHDIDDAMLAQALNWHLRLRDADEVSWQGFTEWLESDPAHNAAYEEIVSRDASIEGLVDEASFAQEPVPQPVAANDEDEFAPSQAAFGWQKFAAIAATLVIGVLLASQVLMSGADQYTITTKPGEPQVIALSDGGQIAINGGSEVVLDRNDERQASLINGEALFTIVHNDERPFVVTVGEERLIDLGTVFNVVNADGDLRVAVAEGEVRYEGASTVDLVAGEAMRRSAEGTITRSSPAKEFVGGWRDGMLVYDGAILPIVMGDVMRSTGIPIELSDGLAMRNFSGVIQTTGDEEALRQRLESLLGVSIEESSAGWTVQP